MAGFEFKILIKKPTDIVWKAFIDPDNMLRYTKYLEKVEIVSGKFGEIGAIGHLHYMEKGKPYVFEDKLLEYEEGGLIKSQVSRDAMIFEVESTFESKDNNTLFSMKWTNMSKSLFVRFIINLLKNKIAKDAEAEIRHFKNLVEEYGIKFP